MVKIENFYPYVMPYADGASEMLVEQYLLDTAIDFCSKTLIVQRDLDPLTMIPGIVEYDLEQPPQQKIHMLMRAFHGASEIEIISQEMVATNPAHYGNWFYAGATVPEGTPNAIFQKNEKSLLVNRAPHDVEPIIITISAALKPARNATQLDDILYDDYAQVLALGTAARLLMLPGKAFSSPQMAVAYDVQYQQARSLAHLRAATSFGRGSLRVRLPNI
jgi:hypothetical protein